MARFWLLLKIGRTKFKDRVFLNEMNHLSKKVQKILFLDQEDLV